VDTKLSDNENIKLIMQVYGVNESEARFILAMEKGEIDGDVVTEE
jgi:hypothetical protein